MYIEYELISQVCGWVILGLFMSYLAYKIISEEQQHRGHNGYEGKDGK